MLPELALGVALAKADLSVKAFTAKTMNNAVQQALGVRPAAEPKGFSLKFGNDKDLRSALNSLARTASECAIPLLEVKGGDGSNMDPLAKPTVKSNFDAMAKPAPIGPCPFRK
jgi:hypothetical protein